MSPSLLRSPPASSVASRPSLPRCRPTAAVPAWGLWLAATLGGGACSSPTGEETSPYAASDALPFRVLASDPQAGAIDVVRDGWISLRFSDFPDLRTLYFPSVRIGPRGTSVQYTAQVDLVTRQLRLRPRSPLLPGTDVLVDVGSALRSLAGQPLERSYRIVFRTGDRLLPPTPPAQTVRLADLLGPGGALAGRCTQGACHSGSSGRHPAADLPLDIASGGIDGARAALLSGRRRGVDGVPLVDVGSPETSYLLRKLLAAQPHAFTRIEGSPMPPFSDALSDEALQTIDAWIRGGAN